MTVQIRNIVRLIREGRDAQAAQLAAQAKTSEAELAAERARADAMAAELERLRGGGR